MRNGGIAFATISKGIFPPILMATIPMKNFITVSASKRRFTVMTFSCPKRRPLDTGEINAKIIARER